MMTIEEIRERLPRHRISKVAGVIGCDPSTLYSIMNDPLHDPRYKTVKLLSEYLAQNEAVS